MSTAQGHMNDKLRNHGLPAPKEAETVGRIAALLGSTPWEKQPAVIAEQIRKARAHERRKTLEEAATQCSILGLIDNQERKNAIVDVRSWNAAVVKCRDTLRALATSSEPGEDT